MPLHWIVIISAGTLVILPGIALLIRALIEPRLLDTDYARLSIDGKSAAAGTGTGDEPDGNPKLRVVFFSDIHGKGCKVAPQKIVDAVFLKPCDAILFGGDVTSGKRDAGSGLSILRMIADQAEEHAVPCYAVRGNHDQKVTAEDFAAAGFRLLANESVTLKSTSGDDYLLIGLHDSGKRVRVWPDLPEHLPPKIPPERRIVMVHNPDYICTIGYRPVYRFQLSGHLHGGQIYLPFRLEFKLLRHDRLPSEGIIKGPFSKSSISGYISRGLGCVIIPLRLFSKPQISHIEIG